jgi:ATP-dependent RNA helicase RhlE
VHRVGRTGRGNKRGQALSFCSKDEVVFLEDIEEYTGEEIQRFELTNGEYEDILGATDDGSYNWKKLIDEEGGGDEW